MSRWKKWLLRTLPVAVLVPLAGVLIDRQLTRRAGEERLAAVVAGLDATDPGWRLDDLLAPREKAIPPDEENVYVLAERVSRDLPPAFRKWEQNSEWRKTDEPNRLPRPADLATARQVWDESRAVIEQARRARTMPRGGVRLVVLPNPLNTKLDHVQRVRDIAWLMDLDVIIAAADRRPDEAVAASLSSLTAGRVIGDEPMQISMLVRMAMAAIAVDDLERTLGWTEPAAGLRELQEMMLAEADQSLLYLILRAERAFADRVFQSVDEGKVGVAVLTDDGRKPTSWDSIPDWAYSKFLPDDHALYLEMITAAVQISRRPTQEWTQSVSSLPLPTKEFRHLLSVLLTPAFEKAVQADLRTKARLRSAAAAVACERFRRATGKWPATLAELPKDLLPAVPTDPYTGNPLRLTTTDDGLVVYSVGPDRTDDHGRLTRTYRPNELGVDYGFRLWDAARRRLDPLPDPPADP